MAEAPARSSVEPRPRASRVYAAPESAAPPAGGVGPEQAGDSIPLLLRRLGGALGQSAKRGLSNAGAAVGRLGATAARLGRTTARLGPCWAERAGKSGIGRRLSGGATRA